MRRCKYVQQTLKNLKEKKFNLKGKRIFLNIWKLNWTIYDNTITWPSLMCVIDDLKKKK